MVVLRAEWIPYRGKYRRTVGVTADLGKYRFSCMSSRLTTKGHAEDSSSPKQSTNAKNSFKILFDSLSSNLRCQKGIPPSQKVQGYFIFGERH